MAKLTEVDVLRILNLAADGILTNKEISEQFPFVTPAMVLHIIYRRNWTHIPFDREIPNRRTVENARKTGLPRD